MVARKKRDGMRRAKDSKLLNALYGVSDVPTRCRDYLPSLIASLTDFNPQSLVRRICSVLQ
jgi:hypothetical protein